jgi:hypothetical protein
MNAHFSGRLHQRSISEALLDTTTQGEDVQYLVGATAARRRRTDSNRITGSSCPTA